MKKLMNVVTPMISIACLTATSYMLLKNRKNIMDILIEEIETMSK